VVPVRAGDMPIQRPIRVVHLDPEGFTDLDTERTIFQRELDSVIFEEVDASGESIGERVGEADVLLTHYATVPAEAMDSTGCSVIARYSTGVDGINVAAATDHGVAVTNVPTYCDEEVGEHVIALAISLVRSLPHADAHTATGGWEWQSLQRPRTAADLTFGCFAFGRKAMAAADRAAALGFEVIAHDPYIDERDIREAGVKPVTFEELLERSDVLSLHAPLTDETKGLFDADVLGCLPEDAILINTARGGLVDEGALVEALEDGPLSGAGLDVLAMEPPRSDNPLLDRDDTIVTPHTAWYSDGALKRVRTRGSENATAALQDEIVDGVVNPEAFGNR
jgi:D-3-phosphoglycerate dehydrogenase